jgi:hypothetical protein
MIEPQRHEAHQDAQRREPQRHNGTELHNALLLCDPLCRCAAVVQKNIKTHFK